MCAKWCNLFLNCIAQSYIISYILPAQHEKKGLETLDKFAARATPTNRDEEPKSIVNSGTRIE